MTEEEIKNIGYFKDIIAIKEIKRGYEKRKKYIITTRKKEYFIKVLPNKLNINDINKLKLLYEIYENVNIPTVPLSDIIVYKNKTLLIYPKFEGANLKDAKLSLEQYYKYGIQIGYDVIKLNKYGLNSKLFSSLNIEEYCKNDKNNLEKIWNNLNYQNKILQIFSKEDLQYLSKKYHSLLNYTDNQQKLLNHNDIKIENVMIDGKNNYYIIDIDPFDSTPCGFNVYYSMYCFILQNFEEEEKAFLRGFIQTIDPNRDNFKQFYFFLLADVVNEAESLLNKHLNKVNDNKNYIKDILWNKNDALEKAIYDIKY